MTHSDQYYHNAAHGYGGHGKKSKLPYVHRVDVFIIAQRGIDNDRKHTARNRQRTSFPKRNSGLSYS